MNITSTTRTIIEYPCTFSLEDLQLADTDPYLFGEKFRELIQPLLRPAGANGNGRHPNQTPPKLGRGRKGAGKRATPKDRSTSRTLLNECPHCRQMFSRAGNLANHIEKVHPEKAPGPATAPAAA